MNAKTTAQTTVELEKFLVFAACTIRTCGYVNSTKAKETNVQSTGQIAWEWATKGRPVAMRSALLLPEDKATGAMVAKWMGEIKPGSNDYMVHLAGIGKATVINEREIGYAASAIQAWQKESTAAIVASNSAEKYIGTVGEKISVVAKFLGANGFDSTYGYCFAYRFEDAQGRKISWLTSKNPSELNVTMGCEYSITGTVKKHNSFGGKYETELTRAKINR